MPHPASPESTDWRLTGLGDRFHQQIHAVDCLTTLLGSMFRL